MDWIQQWQSKLNKQNGVAPLVRTGGSRHTGLAALPHRNIQQLDAMSRNDFEMSICMYKASFNSRKLTQNDICGIILIGKAYTRRKA